MSGTGAALLWRPSSACSASRHWQHAICIRSTNNWRPGTEAHDGLFVHSQVIIGNAMRSELSAQPIRKEIGKANQKKTEELKRAAGEDRRGQDRSGNKSRTKSCSPESSPSPLPSGCCCLTVENRDVNTANARMRASRLKASKCPSASAPSGRVLGKIVWSRMIDPAGNRGGHSSTGGAPAPSFGCRFRPPAVEDSPALSNGAGHSSLLLLSSPRINRTRRLPSPCRTHITTASIALWSLRASLNFSTLGASLPPPRRGPASAHSFRDSLSLFRSANVTRPPRILQANRVVAHASYLRSFKPFHTTSAPSSPQAQQPASSQQQQPRPLQRSAFDSTQLGVGACSPS
ncbi:hypothetical protein V8E51_017015 [Hyaloscypha variabilis]